MDNKLTYKDFKIGQSVVCVKISTENYRGGDFEDERLILGESYKITDVDFHFPDKICVKLKGPYYFHNEFVPIECFADISYIRNLKLDKILNKDGSI